MSNPPFVKVSDAHVQENLKEVLRRIDNTPLILDRQIRARTSPQGCIERLLPDEALLTVGCVVSRLRKAGQQQGEDSNIVFELFLHNEAGSARELDCPTHNSVLALEHKVVSAELNSSYRGTTTDKTTSLKLLREPHSPSSTENNLCVVRRVTTSIQNSLEYGSASHQTDESSRTYLRELSEFDEILREFLNYLQLPN